MGEVPRRQRSRYVGRYGEDIAVTGEAITPARWLELDLDDSWTVAFRFADEGGELVIAEIRVVPKDRREPGKERRYGEWDGDANRVPSGGLPKALIEQLPFRFAKELAQHKAREAQEQFAIPDIDVGHTPRRSGRRGDPQLDAQVADLYAKEVANGNTRPNRAVADTLSLDLKEVRKRVKQARDKGYLTGAGQGRAGGELTAKGKAALRKT